MCVCVDSVNDVFLANKQNGKHFHDTTTVYVHIERERNGTDKSPR